VHPKPTHCLSSTVCMPHQPHIAHHNHHALCHNRAVFAQGTSTQPQLCSLRHTQVPGPIHAYTPILVHVYNPPSRQRTCNTFAPEASHNALMELMEEMRCARKALA